MAKKDKVEYKIHKIHTFLDEKKSKVYVRVSWNDRPPKDEVRTCWMKDGQLMLGKGLALSPADIDLLHEFAAIAGADSDSKEDEGVDFDDIFRRSTGVMDLRERGYTTEDGFIKLSRKDGK